MNLHFVIIIKLLIYYHYLRYSNVSVMHWYSTLILCSPPFTQTETIARLMLLFPETALMDIQEAVNKASNEEMAVCELLLKGEPINPHNSVKKDKKTTKINLNITR